MLSFDPSYCRNEKEVEGKLIIQYLLPQLGYSPDTWFQEVAFNSIRLDFLAFATQILPFQLSANSPLSLIIEAKHPNQNLDHHVFKLKNYLRQLGVRYGILTNGRHFRIYYFQDNQIILKFTCLGSEIDANLDLIRRLIGKDQIKASLLQNSNLSTSTISTTLLSTKIGTKSSKPMKVIAVYHNKGGVGKTTTVVNLAAALAKQGQRVLIVDLDSQANTTYAVGLAKFIDEANDDIKGNNISQVIGYNEEYEIGAVARKTTFSQFEVDAIPAHIELMEYENQLNAIDSAKMRLHKKLNKVSDKYDVVLIDTPPSLNLYARIALITSDYLIIPSDLKPFSHEGLNNVRNFIELQNETKELFGLEHLNVMGVLPSKISTNPKFLASTYPKRQALVTEKYYFPVMDSIIFEREDLAKALENCVICGDDLIPDPRSVLDFRPNSRSASEFEALAVEVLKKTELL